MCVEYGKEGTHSFLVATLRRLDFDLDLPVIFLCASNLSIELEFESLFC